MLEHERHGVHRRQTHRLVRSVERRVENSTAAAALFELVEHAKEPRRALLVDGLHARRAVDVYDGSELGRRGIAYLRGRGHETRHRLVDAFEELVRARVERRGGERTEGLALFDCAVEALTNGLGTCGRQDRAVTERAWPPFVAARNEADDLARRDPLCRELFGIGDALGLEPQVLRELEGLVGPRRDPQGRRRESLVLSIG